MKVLQLSTAARSGGAGIAACRLHQGLRSLGVDSMMLVNKNGNQLEDFIIGPTGRLAKAIARLSPFLDRVPGHLSGLSQDRISSSWVPNRLLHRVGRLAPDILNLHWVNDGFMRIETLPGFQQPVVWTLHDMWSFAGGEHYVGDSVRYREGYSGSNRPASETGLDINRWIWARKKKSWSNLKTLVVATPSHWLAKCARESVLFRDLRIEVLPNGVDHERFHPLDHRAARISLGLPEDKKLILFGAGSATSDKRKGFHLLIDTLNYVGSRNAALDCELVVFGASSGDDLFSMKTHYLGTLRDEIHMAGIYAAADVFVAPSIEDNLPNTVLESLSCGTPVVAFDIGGMPDMVSHKNNGFLAPGFDTMKMAQGLLWVMEDKQRWERLSAEARRTVERSFTLQHFASRYLSLYEEMLGR